MAGSACGSKTSSSPPTPARSASTTRRAISRSSADGRRSRVKLDGASFLLQWATGGLLFLWVTTRRREVSLGYGWLMRATYGLIALGAAYVGLFVIDPLWIRDAASLGVVAATGLALAVSITRRNAGVAGQRTLVEARSARVAAMTGIDRAPRERVDDAGPEFPPVLDLLAPVIGAIGIAGTGLLEGSPP